MSLNFVMMTVFATFLKSALPSGAIDCLGNAKFRHSCNVVALAFSPKGDFLASGANTNNGGRSASVKVWDITTGKLHQEFQHECTCVTWFSDGKRIASAGRDGTIKVWNVESGQELFSSSTSGGWAYQVAVSPNGKFLVSGHGNRHEILLWDVASGKKVRDFAISDDSAHNPQASAESVAFHPNGKWVSAGVPKVGLVIWDIESGKELRRIPGQYSSHRYMENRPITFSGDRGYVAVCQTNGVGIYDPQNGELVKYTRGTRDSDPTRMEISAIAQTTNPWMLALVRNGDLKLWDMTQDREIQSFTTPNRSHGPFVLSADGSILARTEHNSVILWDTATGKRLHSEGGHDAYVKVAGFGAAGEAYTVDCTGMRVWDVGPGGQRRGETVKIRDGVIALSPDGQTVVHGGYSYLVRPTLSDMRTGKIKLHFEVEKDEQFHTSAVFHPDGKRLVTVDMDRRSLSIWDMATGKRLNRLHGHHDPIDTITISHDGKKMATSGTPRAYMRKPFPGHVEDSGIRIWDLQNGNESRQIPGRAHSLAYSPDGKLLAISLTGWEHRLQLVDANSGAKVRDFKGDSRGIGTISFTTDGKFLISLGRDAIVHVWDVKTGQEVHQFLGHTGELHHLAISSNGKRLMTSGGDGLVYVWDLNTIKTGSR